MTSESGEVNAENVGQIHNGGGLEGLFCTDVLCYVYATRLIWSGSNLKRKTMLDRDRIPLLKSKTNHFSKVVCRNVIQLNFE